MNICALISRRKDKQTSPSLLTVKDDNCNAAHGVISLLPWFAVLDPEEGFSEHLTVQVSEKQGNFVKTLLKSDIILVM